MTRTHNRRLKRLNKQLEETTPLLKGLDMLKQIEAIPINTKYYFKYGSLKGAFSKFFFHVEIEKLIDADGPYLKYLLFENKEAENAYFNSLNEKDELFYKLFIGNLEALAALENHFFEEWLVSSGFAETFLKASKGNAAANEELKRVTGRFGEAGRHLGNRKVNEKANREVWPEDIPEDLEVMYQEMREKIEAKGEINL